MVSRRKVVKTGVAALGAVALGKPGIGPGADSRFGIVGRRAPELEVGYWIDRFGEPTRFRLADHEGQWIFLKCWQSWCPGCHSHGFPALQQIAKALGDNAQVAIAGIQTVFEGHAANTVDKVRATQLQYDLQIPMGHDPGVDRGAPQTMRDYRTGGTPWMILIDPARTVVFNDYGIDADKAIAFLRRQTA